MINIGKQFEKDFADSIPDYCYLHRLKDTSQSYVSNKNTSFSWNNECDFFVYNSNTHILYAIECKTTKYKSMSFQLSDDDKTQKMIKYHQIKSLTEMSKYDGIIAGLFINFRDENKMCERTYFINIIDFNNMVSNINKTSFNEMDIILNNAVKISGEKKRIHYRWNIEELFVRC